MRKHAIMAVLACCAMASLAFADMSEKYKEWPKGPAGYLMTKADRKAYDRLETDAQAQAFIELFWARRDPDLNTKVNEFKQQFDLRVEAADKQFGYGTTPGDESDRGRTLIIMGPPSRHSFYPAGNVMTAPGSTTPSSGGDLSEAGGSEPAGATEVWEYLPDKLPAGVKAPSVLFVFRETRPNHGDFPLDRSDRHNIQAMKLLGDAPERLDLHPDLKEVPKLGFLAGSKAATPEQLAVFAQTPQPWPAGAAMFRSEGVTSTTNHPLWVWLQLPETSPAVTQAVGRVTKAGSGEEVGTFAETTNPVNVDNGRGYEFAFPLDAGAYKVDLALLGDAGPVAATSFDATVDPVPTEGAYLSPFVWGKDARQEANAKLGDPFNVGGWHIIPEPDNHFTTKDSVAYFCYVLRPTLDTQSTPQFALSLGLFMGDKKLTETPPQPVQLSHVSGDLWMFGHGLPLQSFRRGGDFKLVVTLKDSLGGVSRSTEIPLSVERVDEQGKPIETPAAK
jgi:GWxTD domain-containing protein